MQPVGAADGLHVVPALESLLCITSNESMHRRKVTSLGDR